MRYRSALICCIFVAGTAGAEAEEDLASRVVAMTGARTKIVWVHATDGRDGKNSDVLSPDYELMTFDSADGKTRTLLPGPTIYACPWITPSGKQIVYTGEGDAVFAVGWDGKGKRQIASGVAYCVWADPKDKTEWVFVANRGYGDEVYRHRLDKPSVRKLVWRGPTSIRFRVSADGTRAGGEFSWPKAGVANLTNGTWKRYGSGCNSMIAPDNSYRFFHMGESAGHHGVMMYDPGGTGKRVVRFRGMPGANPRDASWIPKWSSDVRFLTINAPSNGKRAEVYLGQFDRKFTRVDKWVRITNQPGQDAYAYAWIDPGLGQYFGEAPLTVAIPASLTPGRWQWDYGDGTKQTAPAGKHTYKKLGAYTIVARQGKKVLKGWVNVQDRAGPTVTSARLQDQTHVLLTFSEPVQLKGAKASLASGRAVKTIRMGRDGISLTIELADNLDKKDELILDGVLDLAASPNPMQANRIAITPPSWPTDRSGLVLLWETARAPNIYYNPREKAFGPIDLNSLGPARPDRLGAMSFTGGLFAAYGSGDGVVGACKRSDQLAIQATITPAAEQDPGGARILACDRRGGNWRQTNFALHQEAGKLVFYLRTRAKDDAGGLYGTVRRVELCALDAGAANHCVVSYRPGELKCWLNGKPVRTSGEVKGTLSWGRPDRKAGVHFGAVWGADPASLPWRGKLEGVAIFSRAIDASQVARDYAEYAKRLAARKPVAQVTIRGTLAAASPVPKPRDIAPYHSALVVHEYDVAKVLAGAYAAKKIRVARWGLIHRKKTPVARAKLGEQRELVLERFSDHPELGVELVSNTLADNFDLELYVEADATVKVRRPVSTADPAKARLGLAKSYLAAGMKSKAKKILLDIVKSYPKSRQSDEARDLLKKLRSPD